MFRYFFNWLNRNFGNNYVVKVVVNKELGF